MNKIEKTINLIRKEVKKFQEPVVSGRYDDPFHVLISCLLSLRTRDETTAKASERLFSLASNPNTMLKLSSKKIEKAIYPVGFYRTKAKRIKEICKTLIKYYNGKVPDTEEELLKLKGVGRKTCNIVLTYGHKKKSHIAVDVHLNRIPNRLGWIKTKTPEQTEFELYRIVPKKYWPIINDTFVTFGQNICTPISPKCSICPVNKLCKKVGVAKSR